jgi:GNAT superfamily N-acetyltransferase
MNELNNADLRKLTFGEVQKLIDWAASEGWNPGLHDAEVFWAADPDGFYGYFLNDQMIAGGSVVSYQGAFGFMGLFLVQPEWRGKGLGKILWKRRREIMMNRLVPGASIGMDGVVEMQAFYRKGGFEIAFIDERHLRKGESFFSDSRIGLMLETDWPMILEIDHRCFGFSREAFLFPWLHQPDSFVFTFREADRATGFACMRKTRSGYKVGPLFAPTITEAEELYKACLNKAIGEWVSIDIPLANPAATDLMRSFGTSLGFSCARMYLGPEPSMAIHQVFGLTTFELG